MAFKAATVEGEFSTSGNQALPAAAGNKKSEQIHAFLNNQQNLPPYDQPKSFDDTETFVRDSPINEDDSKSEKLLTTEAKDLLSVPPTAQARKLDSSDVDVQ